MYFLPKPLMHVSAADIYDACAKSYSDPAIRSQLLTYSERIRAEADRYPTMVPGQIEAFLEGDSLDKDTAEKMAALYKKLSAGPRKKYRDEILAQTTMDCCAICGRDHAAETLDHYLPKSRVPTMAVVPINLVPCCQKCNNAKLDTLLVKPDEALIHMYLDELSEGNWLHAQIQFEQKPVVHFHVRCPEGWIDRDRFNSRLHKQMEVYDLYRRYSLHSASELINLRDMWPSRYDRKNAADVLEYLHERRIALEKGDRTQWRPALYRALEEQVEEFCLWLTDSGTD